MSFFEKQRRRIAGGNAVGIAVLATATAGALAAVTHPVAASAALDALSSAVSCATSAACVSGTNSSSGPGVAGTSAKGAGVQGKSTSGSGVSASATSGTAVSAISTSGNAVYGYSTSYTSVHASSSSNVYPAAFVDNFGGADGIDVIAQSGGCSGGCAAVSARSNNGYALLGATGNGGVPLYLKNLESGTTIFYVNNVGDVFFHGSLYNFARVPNGATVKSFSAKMAVPTVEDVGAAQLVGGSAAVALDPTFAASIDPRTVYHVFLTPNGDTRGLYVAAKTPAGFVVRETGGGHGTLSFDYRIVATAQGQTGQRMAVIDPASLPNATVPSAQQLNANKTAALPYTR